MHGRKSSKIVRFHEDRRKLKKTQRTQGLKRNIPQFDDHYDDKNRNYNDDEENGSFSDNDATFYEECRSMCTNNDLPYFGDNGVDDLEPTLDDYKSDEDDDSTKGM